MENVKRIKDDCINYEGDSICRHTDIVSHKIYFCPIDCKRYMTIRAVKKILRGNGERKKR